MNTDVESILQTPILLRDSNDSIAKDYELINSLEYFKDVMNSISIVSLVINRNRQIIFASKEFLSLLGLTSVNLVLGLRPGESILCIHAFEKEGGCGMAVACAVCGTDIAVSECQRNKKSTIKEARITSEINDKIISWDFLITANPIQINNGEYSILTFKDISAEKKKQNFEKIFFHDINNVTLVLNGFANRFNAITDEVKKTEFIEFIENASSEILDQIASYHQLISAENSELEVNKTPFVAQELIKDLVGIASNYDMLKSNFIITDIEMIYVNIKTDRALLSRILLNMLKNAIEAISDMYDAKITIGIKNKNESFRFWVHNNGVIPISSQLQIFQRSFSTKGNGRGLGTYSMKILGENYLKGKVGFISNENTGTLFFIDLPMK